MKGKNLISIRGARVHNLKNVSLDIPKNTFTVMTGLSGSGKSSLAFDTIHAEGQRRYMESLSSYARQFMELQDKADADEITGLSPTIAIDQKASSHNPRSTVGTVTEIYDFLRLLFARAGRAHCIDCGNALMEQQPKQMVEHLLATRKNGGWTLLAPMVQKQKGEHKVVLQAAKNAEYLEVRFDGTLVDIDELMHTRFDKTKEHTIEVVIARQPLETQIVPETLLPWVKQALELGNGFLIVWEEESGKEELLSKALFCSICRRSFPALEPRLFSFNSPHGACPSCTGLGTKLVLESNLVIPNKRLTLAQGAIKPFTRVTGNQQQHIKLMEAVGLVHGFSIHQPVAELSLKARKIILEGVPNETFEVDGKILSFPGIITILEEKYRETDSEYVQKEIESYMRILVCPDCCGLRLRKEALAVRVAGKSIADLVRMPLQETFAFATWLDQTSTAKKKPKDTRKLKLAKKKDAYELGEKERKVAVQIAHELTRRVKNLIDVGLDYLTLDRPAISLSGGEAQRVRLAAQLGSELSGVIYILDEPSIGLHPRDNNKLIEAIKRLRDLENTVIVVEHDKNMIEEADFLVDVGPGAGEFGGEIVAVGSVSDIKRAKDSVTGAYLSGRMGIARSKSRRMGNGKSVTVHGASAFNLKNIDVSFPLGKFVCITGVSGSGKSTLVLDILGRALSVHFFAAKELPGAYRRIDGIEHLDKVVSVDQSPIGRTPRSNPATYTGVFTQIRDLFTEIPEAKIRGFDAGKFSFNVKGGGRCEACGGDGYVQIPMQFLPDVYVECSECHGRRYNVEALEIHWRGKNISDILAMTVEEARRFFVDKPLIYDKLSVLHEVGLGYVKLGQPATTLSGGEAQRVKLSTELSRRATGKTLYILDEPTTGLHFDDIKRLLAVLNALVDKGNTVLVIEHNLDVIKCADWIIDMGPEGGEHGGQIVAEGRPEDLVKTRASFTGRYLKKVL